MTPKRHSEINWPLHSNPPYYIALGAKEVTKLFFFIIWNKKYVFWHFTRTDIPRKRKFWFWLSTPRTKFRLEKMKERVLTIHTLFPNFQLFQSRFLKNSWRILREFRSHLISLIGILYDRILESDSFGCECQLNTIDDKKFLKTSRKKCAQIFDQLLNRTRHICLPSACLHFGVSWES